jgi:hypothetical protein
LCQQAGTAVFPLLLWAAAALLLVRTKADIYDIKDDILEIREDVKSLRNDIHAISQAICTKIDMIRDDVREMQRRL